MKHDIDWSKSHGGVMLCTFEETYTLMPEVKPILEELMNSNKLEFPIEDYLVDVKIHMLMRNQYPCIPNWHRDFVPRDENLKPNPSAITGEKMYMWLSNEPLTEYKGVGIDNYLKEPQIWHEFTQRDWHRGTLCNKHIWRCFIRVIPKWFVHSHTKNAGKIRRHTQVYLNDKNFTW